MTIHTRIPDYDPPCTDYENWIEHYADEHSQGFRQIAHDVLIWTGTLLICAGPAWAVLSIICRGSW